MSAEPRAIDLCASVGVFGAKADVLRRYEERLEELIAAESFDEDEPLLVEMRRLISEQIVGLELKDGYRVVANGKLYRVTQQKS
jgi:hypothetical protein